MGPSSEPAAPRERRRQLATAAAAALGLAAAAVLWCAVAPGGAGGEAQQSSLRPQVAAAAGARRLYSTSTSYCYEQDNFGDCWASKPTSSTTEFCTPSWTPSSSEAACRCPESPGSGCLLNELSEAPPTTGRCSEVKIYVPGGHLETQPGTGNIDVTGSGTAEVYCENMVKNDEWRQKKLLASNGDGPAENGKSYWRCWYPYTWKNGKCQRRKRFLLESCWDGWFGSGECEGSDTSYDEYSTSCYEGKCVPYAEAQTRHRCDCAWFGWNFIFACSAADGQCGGHACVLSTGDGNKYCDYASSQNW